ncbi:MAG: NADH-quinone oxidoreductase subunit C [Lachnospiraceae bacterium]|nr:NADH-quinone oxidoreductase subunit C [Lachnospiraceae bacterium]
MERELREIEEDTLLNETQKVHSEGYRLIQICATTVDSGYEILYTFGKGYDELSIRFLTKGEKPVQSISRIFPPAWLYENEIHDLFGIEVENMTLDFRGGLYRTSVKAPFARKEA